MHPSTDGATSQILARKAVFLPEMAPDMLLLFKLPPFKPFFLIFF